MAIRREPTRRRKSAFRDERRNILIVCGADETESAYFKGLRDALRLASLNVSIVAKGKVSPDEVVRHAKRKMDGAGYHEVWCVVDVDHYERDGGWITKAMKLADQSGIRLAVSNPCFEFWLVLHHAVCGGHCADCGAAEGLLKRWLPTYDKTRLRFADHANGVSDAVKRAKVLDPTGRNHVANPSAGVWPLVEMLLLEQK